MALVITPVPIPQTPLEELAGRGSGQFGLEINACRTFDFGEMLTAKINELPFQIGIGVRHVHGLNHGFHLFTEFLIGNADDSHVQQSALAEDDPWLDYVPLRMANTIVVEERLPQGAAAVLINQSHTYPDIYLPINGQEKRLFAAIDGKHAIGEIMAAASKRSSQSRRRTRDFFERLWQYDQVVFDASQRHGAKGSR